MKKCPECFSEIMLQYNFCPNCGKKQYNTKPVGVGDPDDPISDNTKKETEIIKEEKEDFSDNNEQRIIKMYGRD